MADAYCRPHRDRGIYVKANRIVDGSPICQDCIDEKPIVAPVKMRSDLVTQPAKPAAVQQPKNIVDPLAKVNDVHEAEDFPIGSAVEDSKKKFERAASQPRKEVQVARLSTNVIADDVRDSIRKLLLEGKPASKVALQLKIAYHVVLGIRWQLVNRLPNKCECGKPICHKGSCLVKDQAQQKSAVTTKALDRKSLTNVTHTSAEQDLTVEQEHHVHVKSRSVLEGFVAHIDRQIDELRQQRQDVMSSIELLQEADRNA